MTSGEWERGIYDYLQLIAIEKDEKKQPTLAGGPSRTEVKGRDKENLLSERRRSEFTDAFRVEG